jgi:hypothetical protein
MEQQRESSVALDPVVTTASGPTEEEPPLNVRSMALSILHDNVEEGAVGSTDEMDSSDVIANVVIAPSASNDDVKSKDKDLEGGFLEATDETDFSDVCSLSVAGGIANASDVIANVVIAPSASNDDVESIDKDPEEGFLGSTDETDFSDVGSLSVAGGIVNASDVIANMVIAPSASNDDVESIDKDPEEGSDVCSLSVAGGMTLLNGLRPFSSWSRERARVAALGCLSSSVVLMIRLLLDKEPTAYIIHSVVVFIDMVLIHLFTNSRWLSLSGELMTVVFFLAFHFTTETVWELLETTGIAVLCSFHMIKSRNKHMDHEEQLEVDIESIRQHTFAMLTHGDFDHNHFDSTGLLSEHEEGMTSASTSSDEKFLTWVITPEDPNFHSRHVKGCGKHFFEHFLDGSAGVMYTSFLGLIIDELLTYGQD